MSVQTTPNLGLTLPYQSDPVAVSTQNDNMTIIDNAYGTLNDQIASKQDTSNFYSNSLSRKTYSFNIVRGLTGNYWFALMYIGCSANSISQGLYMIHIDTSNNVTINSLAGTAQAEGYTFTGSYSNSVLTLTCNSTVWGGIRVIMI